MIGGNRFNSEERGAWFCAWDVMVSVSGVAWHRARELGFTGSFCDRAHVALLADFIAEFDELTDEPSHPALSPEPAVGYPEGRNWRPDYGVREPWPDQSLRAAGGNSLACFEPRGSGPSGRGALGSGVERSARLFGHPSRSSNALPKER
ncbi:RES family NAD+ phosphorylase [Sinorhizobium medicae]|uniref:RES family NAD+ phosphorylase n=1 Tax=Sinorhizobium medicae TaxID=110321 RepID=UPI001F425DEE|nr:RES family NAD+ phosphorylase [Sinorhizobium medicae]